MELNHAFSRLRTAGYRRLRDLDLALKPFNVLIGANGVGKTSVLEVMRLLAASAEGRLMETLSAQGGISSLLPAGCPAQPLTMLLEMPVAGANPLEYRLDLRASGLAYGIAGETLIQDRGEEQPFKYIDSQGAEIRYFDIDTRRLLRPTWEHKQTETSLSQVPKMFREPEHFRQLLASSSLYHALDVSPRAPVRMPQAMRPALMPGKDGEDMVSCLYYLRESDRARFEAVEDTLRVAFPTFERLDFPPVAAGTISMAWRDKQFTAPIHPHQLSEGSLRFLWLVALLQSPELPTVLLIDEPEVSLHPEMLQLLAGLLREAAGRCQIIVATHSDRFVRFLDPAELLVCDLDEEGGTHIVRADELDLHAWLEDYTLDQLWGMGRLGGRG